MGSELLIVLVLLRANEGAHKTSRRPSLVDWIEEYKLADRAYRLRVTDRSSVVGKTLEELNLRSASGTNIVAIERDRKFSKEILGPTAKTELKVDDILLIDLFAPDGDVEALRLRLGLEERPLSGAYFTDQSQEIGMAEVILPPNSELIGKTIGGAKFRTRFGLTVLGMRRVCLALVVGLMVSGLIPNVQAALIGCLLMGLLGCIDFASAYRSIDWKTIVLIVGMLPFSIALQRTGGIDLAADGLWALTSGAGNARMFISNTATAVLMAPVAVALAKEMTRRPIPSR